MDPRLRFGNRRFKTKLQLARQFRRNSGIQTENKFQKFFKVLGLKTFFKQLLAVLILLIFVFSIYFPNWFFVRHINIQGAGDIEVNVREAAFNYFSFHKFWPQQNLLLLKKSGLSAYLEKNLSGILKVEKIEKRLFHSLNIFIQKRVNVFFVESQQGNFTVGNDGKISSEIFGEVSSTSSLASLLKLKVNLQNKPLPGYVLISPEWQKGIVSIQGSLPQIVKSPIVEMEIGDLKIPELAVNLENNSKIYLNYSQDLPKTNEQLKLLLSEIMPADLKKLAYIDLRFPGKAFVCLKTAACAKQAPVIYQLPAPTPDEATSTIKSLLK